MNLCMKNQTLTKSEMQLMNILWAQPRGANVSTILAGYHEPRPAYTTVATFLKILVQKGFVESRKGTGKQLIYTPLMTKERYRRQVMAEVKDNFFDGSAKSLLNFFVREERLTAAELAELLAMIQTAQP